MTPQQAAVRAATPHADEIDHRSKDLGMTLSHTEEAAAPIDPSVEHLRAIIVAAENALTALGHPTTVVTA